ncbi:hypothetical protein SAVIM40S_07810 [Streptomyces avidinii]
MTVPDSKIERNPGLCVNVLTVRHFITLSVCLSVWLTLRRTAARPAYGSQQRGSESGMGWKPSGSPTRPGWTVAAGGIRPSAAPRPPARSGRAGRALKTIVSTASAQKVVHGRGSPTVLQEVWEIIKGFGSYGFSVCTPRPPPCPHCSPRGSRPTTRPFCTQGCWSTTPGMWPRTSWHPARAWKAQLSPITLNDIRRAPTASTMTSGCTGSRLANGHRATRSRSRGYSGTQYAPIVGDGSRSSA